MPASGAFVAAVNAGPDVILNALAPGTSASTAARPHRRLNQRRAGRTGQFNNKYFDNSNPWPRKGIVSCELGTGPCMDTGERTRARKEGYPITFQILYFLFSLLIIYATQASNFAF